MFVYLLTPPSTMHSPLGWVPEINLYASLAYLKCVIEWFLCFWTGCFQILAKTLKVTVNSVNSLSNHATDGGRFHLQLSENHTLFSGSMIATLSSHKLPQDLTPLSNHFCSLYQGLSQDEPNKNFRAQKKHGHEISVSKLTMYLADFGIENIMRWPVFMIGGKKANLMRNERNLAWKA